MVTGSLTHALRYAYNSRHTAFRQALHRTRCDSPLQRVAKLPVAATRHNRLSQWVFATRLSQLVTAMGCHNGLSQRVVSMGSTMSCKRVQKQLPEQQHLNHRKSETPGRVLGGDLRTSPSTFGGPDTPLLEIPSACSIRLVMGWR